MFLLFNHHKLLLEVSLLEGLDYLSNYNLFYVFYKLF